MKAEILKIAGAKSEKDFYKKFPTEESFMAKYGKQIKKLQQGGGAMAMMNNLAGSNAFAAGVQSLGDVVGGVQQMKDEKQNMLKAQQMQGVSNVALQASQTQPEQIQRKYVRPEDNINAGQELFPTYGVGTTFAKNGTEIANTFAPNTIYTDLGYAAVGGNFPNFGNQDFMKMATRKNATPGQTSDIYKFAEQGGGNALAQVTAGFGSPKGYGVSGAGKVGGGIGSTVGTIFGGPVGGIIGKFAGQTLGNVLDRKAEKTEKANEATAYNTDAMALGQGAQSLQQANASYMRDGGMANPQIINQFGNYKLSQLLQSDPTMDTLRAGGHLQNYTPPSERAMYTGREQFAMGGDLETHWGGHAEPMSYNPYLPEGGETVMFRGKSHDESDGKGNTGIGITYGDSPVEVERGEPAVQLKNGTGGDNSLTVYGNLVIPKMGAEMIGSPKATGRKFKNYVADLSKTEQKQNKLIDKSVTELDNLDVNNPYDLLKFESYKANMFGANQKLKNIADEKIKLADLQSAINDTAEEYGFEADALAKGKVKQAKKGASIKKAQPGVTQPPTTNLSPVDVTANNMVPKRQPDFSLQLPRNVRMSGLRDMSSNLMQANNAQGAAPGEEEFNWMNIVNQILPYLRPSDAEALDPRQLSGEMLALAQNQLEPVQAQTIQPQLTTPFDISLQDIINQNQSDYRAAQKMIGYNPAALAALNAQKYQANQKVLGEQFRLNQGMKNQVYADNRNILNQANLQNLQGLDQQYVRQQGALSNTKATAQAALNSISAKYLQNQSENRTLQASENLYNYRFDPRFRAMNMNPLAQFNTDLSGLSYEQLLALADLKKKQTPVTTTNTTTIRNGGLVRAIKSM
jgi:hypothetical protein